MTDGTYKTWELIALASGLVVCVGYGLIGKFGGEIESSKPLWFAAMLMSSALFAKPVWLAGNWNKIKTWERTTALVYECFITRHRRGIVHRHVSIEFTSKSGRTFRKTVHNVSFGFKKGQKRDIMFAEEYMDALIFVPLAFRQAVFSAAAGVLLEGCLICLMIFGR